MMQQAQIQFGFEADNIPLMIEAIPVSTESIILIITKVEDPEELDTRFSKFSPFKDGNLLILSSWTVLTILSIYFKSFVNPNSEILQKNPAQPMLQSL